MSSLQEVGSEFFSDVFVYAVINLLTLYWHLHPHLAVDFLHDLGVQVGSDYYVLSLHLFQVLIGLLELLLVVVVLYQLGKDIT